MKILIAILVMVVMVGCASLSDRGDISETSYRMPDGKTMTFVRIQRINFFTPSTEEKATYIRAAIGEPTVRTEDLELNFQNGMGPAVISGAIQAGATIGGAYLLKEGLAESGHEITNSSGSNSSPIQNQKQGQKQGQFQKNYKPYGRRW